MISGVSFFVVSSWAKVDSQKELHFIFPSNFCIFTISFYVFFNFYMFFKKEIAEKL